MDKITLGLKIRQLRERRNLTQIEFAEMIYITDKALSKIEVKPESGRQEYLESVINSIIFN